MNKRFSRLCLSLILAAGLCLSSCNSEKYSYETVPNDPLKAQIYTLPNGLKVYMTVNKEQPRIQTYIAVRVGGKNDPAETTGLAHYFEHLMFKGTESFGTMNYAAEKPLLDSIEATFEAYRHITDEAERKAVYHKIDSLSYEASRYSIPNEYDKLMAAIGANGTNAYTSYDVTCYTEDIPSNQIENWAKVQADRFKHNVIRGFHTELEAVYEEKNMSLTKDIRKVLSKMNENLYKNHPYGTQTVLGTQEQLKNPSITNIKNYYKVWYVPNNMAICVSGDFDPDQMIDVLTQYFGDMTPNDSLPRLTFEPETPITEPLVSEVFGPEAEYVMLGWRFPGAASRDIETLKILCEVLSNGQAGLIDLDLNQPQKVLGAEAFIYDQADYSTLLAYGQAMPGQSLDEVRQLMLDEVKKIRDGEFDEKILQAVINNYKLSQQKQLENNRSRADWFVQSFVNGSNWADEVTAIDRMSQITKADLQNFAQQFLTDANYAVVYKRQGIDPNEVKIAKPEITPILTNRDTASAFLKEIQAATVQPIEPAFIDFDKDMSITTAKQGSLPVLYKQNETNDLFELTYLFDMGNYADRELGLAAQYLDYLGTDSLSPESIKSELYRLACSFSVYPGARRTYVTLRGLNENMPQAMKLLETLMANAKPDSDTYATYIEAKLQDRINAKGNQSVNFSKLRNYAMYGPELIQAQTLSDAELKSIVPGELTDRIKHLNDYKHRILYYGPSTQEEVVRLIDAEHQTPESLLPALANKEFPMQETKETLVFLAPYAANQIYLAQYSNRGEPFDIDSDPTRTLYNEYFGGGMNSIVFQEMRESRGLAYSAWASLMGPGRKEDPYYMFTYIATQNDKMKDAITAFNDIIDNIPESEAAFKLAKDGIISRLRTERTTGASVLWSYIGLQDLGQTTDSNIKLFADVQKMTLQDILAYQQKWIKGRTYYYSILGDEKALDMEALKALGTLRRVSTEEIFGY